MRRFRAFNLFVAFSFTVMADPISSVAYAIEAALADLDGELAELWPTMALVVATVAIVAATYHQLIRRFPSGGGGPEAVAAAFGESWAFMPLAALLIDFTLTVAISCAAGASAIVSYLPELADERVPIALALAVAVAAVIALGHRGRVLFATATLLFCGFAALVLADGLATAPTPGVEAPAPALDASWAAILLAMPLGMALATGLESPSNAIAQLADLDDRGRRIFGQLTVWLLVVIVGGLTLALAALAVSFGLDGPSADSTLLADIARRATGGGVAFAAFQALTALLLLAAAASAYAAGSGVMKALALHGSPGSGLLPGPFGRTNRFLVPWWGVGAICLISCVLIVLAGGDEGGIVGYYAVAVFLSFAAALAACVRLSHRERRWPALAVNALGLGLVAFVIAINVARPAGAIAIAATLLVFAALYWSWIRRGRPGGIAGAVAEPGPSGG